MLVQGINTCNSIINLMLGILANILLLLLWGILLYSIKDDLPLILLGLAIGICGVFSLVGLVQFYLLRISGIPITELHNKTIIGPIVEESAKLAFIFFAAWKNRKILIGLFTFGVAVGLGFAFIENFGFVADLLNLMLRGISSWIMHMITTASLSYGVKSRLALRKNIVWIVFSFLVAMFIHGAFNYFILSLGYG